VPPANDQLRQARERSASAASPGECLSRQELAELVNTYVWQRHQKVVQLDGIYIGKLERGDIRWPGRLYREALRAILGCTDAALGFASPRRAVVKVDVDRKDFLLTSVLGLGGLAMGALAPVAALLEGGEPTPTPTRVGQTEIEQIRTATRAFNSWSRAYGPCLAREAAMGQLRWSAGLLQASCPTRLRPELYSAVAELAETAGYTARGRQEASRVFGFALGCAEQAQDWPLRAEMLSSMAKQAIWTGQPDDGLTLAEQALVRADRLTATGRALLHTDRARALAKMRRVQETLTALSAADEDFARSTPADDPPCISYYGAARHAQCTGHALVDLAVLGGRDPGEATDRLTAAVEGHTNTANTTSRVICLLELASLTMATGDPIQAATIGHEALDAAGAIRSRRVTDDLRELARGTTRHPDIGEVTALRQRITAAVLTS
jgi:hypothetical protein